MKDSPFSTVFHQWTTQGVYFVTRLNENTVYEVMESITNDIGEYAVGGIIRDEIIQLNIFVIELPKKEYIFKLFE